MSAVPDTALDTSFTFEFPGGCGGVLFCLPVWFIARVQMQPLRESHSTL